MIIKVSIQIFHFIVRASVLMMHYRVTLERGKQQQQLNTGIKCLIRGRNNNEPNINVNKYKVVM
jgi:hypothetical protein